MTEVKAGLSFGDAFQAMKDGHRVARARWDGMGMWLGYIRENEWTFTNGKWDNFGCLPFIAMKTAENKIVPWPADRGDVLADDWAIVEGPAR